MLKVYRLIVIITAKMINLACRKRKFKNRLHKTVMQFF